MRVLAFPPRESCNSLVSLELRYGTWEALPSAKDEITFPNVDNDQLILDASRSRRPEAPLLVCRSLPAKSTFQDKIIVNSSQPMNKDDALQTRLSRPTWRVLFPSIPFSLHSTATVKMAWERDEWMFIWVAPTDPDSFDQSYRLPHIRCKYKRKHLTIFVAHRHYTLHVFGVIHNISRQIFDIDANVGPFFDFQMDILVLAQ